MQATNRDTDHNRTLRITGLPSDCDMGELLITINYAVKPNDGAAINKAVALDKHIIPYIIAAINAKHIADEKEQIESDLRGH